MSYKNPIVCKDVYLPVEGATLSYTREEYIDKFGIDIFDIFQPNQKILKSPSNLHVVFLENNTTDNLTYYNFTNEDPDYTIELRSTAFQGVAVTVRLNIDGSNTSTISFTFE